MPLMFGGPRLAWKRMLGSAAAGQARWTRAERACGLRAPCPLRRAAGRGYALHWAGCSSLLLLLLPSPLRQPSPVTHHCLPRRARPVSAVAHSSAPRHARFSRLLFIFCLFLCLVFAQTRPRLPRPPWFLHLPPPSCFPARSRIPPHAGPGQVYAPPCRSSFPSGGTGGALALARRQSSPGNALLDSPCTQPGLYVHVRVPLCTSRRFCSSPSRTTTIRRGGDAESTRL